MTMNDVTFTRQERDLLKRAVSSYQNKVWKILEEIDSKPEIMIDDPARQIALERALATDGLAVKLKLLYG